MAKCREKCDVCSFVSLFCCFVSVQIFLFYEMGHESTLELYKNVFLLHSLNLKHRWNISHEIEIKEMEK